MDIIRFIGSTDLLSVKLGLSDGRITITSAIIPDDEILTLGFEVINEHNGVIQGDFSAYKYVYRKESGYVILTDKEDDVYIAPTYAKIVYMAGDNGTVSLAAETIQTNAESVHVVGSTAKANSGYRFVNWTDANGAEVATTEIFVPTVTATTTDTAYTANFEFIPIPEKTLDEIKAEKSTAIDSAYASALVSGTSTMLSDGTTIHFSINQDFINDASAAFNLASALYGTEDITVPFEINKVCYQYAPLDVIYIYIAMQIYIVACKSLRNELLGTLNRAETKDAVEAITFATESLDETGLEGYQISMASGQKMIDVMKAKFGIVDPVTEETTETESTETEATDTEAAESTDETTTE